VFLSILLAIIYSAVWYVSKAQSGESWNWMKFARTLIIGCGVGAYMVFIDHQSVTLQTVTVEMISINAVIIGVVDKLVTIIWSWFKKVTIKTI
jgi:microcompartment protein CcmK/EutM